MQNKSSQLFISADSTETLDLLETTGLLSLSREEESTLLSSRENDAQSSDTAQASDTVKGTDSAVVWDNTKEVLKSYLDQQIFTAWIKPLSIASISAPPVSAQQHSTNQSSSLGKQVEVSLLAPNKFCCEHVERHYGELLSETLTKILGVNNANLSFKVSSLRQAPAQESSRADNSSATRPLSSNLASTPQSNNTRPKLARTQAPSAASTAGREKKVLTQESQETNLNQNYNFSNFVVGGCNQFAYAASLRVSEHLGVKYNPLFLYGGVGLGKTHLANAIGNAARRRGKKTLLVSSEKFVSELISSLKSNSMDKFKSKFRSLDLLIIDDIQFIIGKERTQEEFFHTFNELYNQNKQIIITSDKIPQELTGLEERLRTRFASGLSSDLQAPDFETRVAIVKKKSEANEVFLNDSVAGLLAERVDTNVRELEGALNRLLAFASLNEREPDLKLAEEVLKSIAPQKVRDVSTDSIQRVVAEKFNVSVHDLVGKRRTHNIAFARQVAMYLCRKLTGCSYPEIGAIFGGRDHSTVIHANKVVSEKLERLPLLGEDINAIEQSLFS